MSTRNPGKLPLPQGAAPKTGAAFRALAGYLARAQVRPALLWGLALGALSALTVVIFPTVRDSMDLSAYLEGFPPEMIALFGLEAETALDTAEGWLATQIFNMWAPLALTFYPILLGANAIAGAEERGRLDMLLSNPLPRWGLVMGSAVAMLFGLLLSLLVLGLMTWLPAKLVGLELSLAATAAAVLNLLPLGLFFGALALLLSALLRRAVLAVALPAALLVIMYFGNALAGLSEALGPARPLSLFHYYGSAIEEGLSWPSFGLILLLALTLALLAVAAFNRRDIYS